MKIHNIFTSISGEVSSFHQGACCTIIRMQGCNLACNYCFGIKAGRHIPKVILSQKPNKRLPNVEVGDILLTREENTLNLVETTVKEVLKRTVDSWFEITINGTIYYVTEEHPFFLTRGIVMAKDLKIGDMIYHSSFQEKLSFRMRGKKNPIHNKDVKDRKVKNTDYVKIGIAVKRSYKEGKHPTVVCSEETKKKIGKANSGKNNGNWKGGKTKNYEILKKKIKEKKIVKCSFCQKQNLPLDVHHKDNNRMNDDPLNLIILCESCHYSEHQIGFNFWNEKRKDGKRLFAINGFEVQKIKYINHNTSHPLKVINLRCSPYNSYLIDYMWVHNCDAPSAQDYSQGKEMTINEIIKIIKKLKNKNILITGGEPFFQYDEVIKLCDFIKFENIEYEICIETNGSISLGKAPALVSIVMDYKLNSSGETKKMFQENFQFLSSHDFVKFVITDDSDFKQALTLIEEFKIKKYPFKIAMSPVTNTIEPKNLFEKIRKADLHDIILNVQLHKLLKIVEPQ